jgi:hypothetical protein
MHTKSPLELECSPGRTRPKGQAGIERGPRRSQSVRGRQQRPPPQPPPHSHLALRAASSRLPAATQAAPPLARTIDEPPSIAGNPRPEDGQAELCQALHHLHQGAWGSHRLTHVGQGAIWRVGRERKRWPERAAGIKAHPAAADKVHRKIARVLGSEETCPCCVTSLASAYPVATVNARMPTKPPSRRVCGMPFMQRAHPAAPPKRTAPRAPGRLALSMVRRVQSEKLSLSMLMFGGSTRRARVSAYLRRERCSYRGSGFWDLRCARMCARARTSRATLAEEGEGQYDAAPKLLIGMRRGFRETPRCCAARRALPTCSAAGRRP